MILQEIFQNMVSHAHVRNVYGEPIVSADRTIVPVAKISYGFGGGSGSKRDGDEGGGGGGGLKAYPAGFIEISSAGARFVPIGDNRKIAGALILGVALGLLLAKRRAGAENP